MKANSGFSLLFAALLGSVVGLGTVHAGEGVAGTAKADKLDVCVEPTDVMRRRHFEFIKHQRDVTVHQAINAPGEFCAACHEYTGATLDCFSCHATTPTGSRE